VIKNNHIKSPLILEYRGFATDEVIEQALIDFGNRKVDVNGYLEAIKDNYDKELF